MTSNFTVLYSQNGDILQYSEMLVSENNLGKFNITSCTDGNFVNCNDTDLTFMSDDQLLQEVNTTPSERMAARSIGSTVACVVARLGVTGGVAYLIVGACAGASAVPGVGMAVCVACIAAYAAVGGASITAVASCFG